MSQNDLLSDSVTRIRNAYSAELKSVDLLFNNVVEMVCKILKEEGYISDYEKKSEDGKNTLHVTLKYAKDCSPSIREIKRVSKPGCRIYIKRKDFKPYKSGYGHFIVSTSKGVMADWRAATEMVGGEVLLSVF